MLPLLLLSLLSLGLSRPSDKRQAEEGPGVGYAIGTSCTIEARGADGSYDEERIKECVDCWGEMDALSEEGLPRAKGCVSQFLPNIATACSSLIAGLRVGDLDQGKEVVQCFLDYVKDNDVNDEVKDGVNRHFEEQGGEAEGDQADLDEQFVIGASCTIEARQADGSYDEERIKECASCWPWEADRNSLSEEGLPQAKSCIEEFMPTISTACQGVIAEINVGDEEKGQEALKCFLDYVKENDIDNEVQNGVTEYIEEENGADNSEDETEYILGTSCTLESRSEDGTYNEDYIEECGACWEGVGDALSEDGLPKAKACMAEYLPNILASCQDLITELTPRDYQKGEEVFACFDSYVMVNDVDREVQEGVAKYLEESADTEYVLGTSCTIENMREDGSFDEEGIQGCGECWEEAGESVDAMKSCTVVHLPRIADSCKEEIEAIGSGDDDEGRKVFRCFYDFVLDNDIDEVVRLGVRDYLDSQK